MEKNNCIIVHKLLESEINSPKTSSMVRAFDAVASLLNIRQVVNYEAQAAIELENIAKKADGDKLRIYPFDIEKDEIDISPMIRAVVGDFRKGIALENIAYNFHYSIAMMIRKVCEQLRSEWGISRVVLSGGVWQNTLLLEMSLKLLEQSKFDVLYHHQVPTNDGGIALGQAVVASCFS
jgi:hydrogenase maturation protein HypF